MSAAYGGIQLPKLKPITLRLRKGQLVPNISGKPTPFYAPADGSNSAPYRQSMRNMGSSTRKLFVTPTHVRTRKLRASRRSRRA